MWLSLTHIMMKQQIQTRVSQSALNVTHLAWLWSHQLHYKLSIVINPWAQGTTGGTGWPSSHCATTTLHMAKEHDTQKHWHSSLLKKRRQQSSQLWQWGQEDKESLWFWHKSRGLSKEAEGEGSSDPNQPGQCPHLGSPCMLLHPTVLT